MFSVVVGPTICDVKPSDIHDSNTLCGPHGDCSLYRDGLEYNLDVGPLIEQIEEGRIQNIVREIFLLK